MTAANRPRKELMGEIESLRSRLEEAEETLRAIGSGEVDAFVVSGADGTRVFTLKGAEQPYRILVETMNEGAATLSGDGTILYCNNRLASMLHTPMERLLGTNIVSYVAQADRPLVTARLEKCSEGCATDEVSLITKEGNAVPVLVSSRQLDLSGSRGISLMVTDLTQQRRNEEIMASERLANSIIEQAGEAIVVCDEEGMIFRASRLAHQLSGKNPLLKPFDEMFRLRQVKTDSFFSVMTLPYGNYSESMEVEFKRSDNQIFFLTLKASPLKGLQGRIVGCVVTLTDITERRQSEEKITASLQEKELLLKEIHHRVKNNLQIITSLLKLQANYVDDERVATIFKECQQQVASMAAVHSMLYKSQNLAVIDFGNYVREMAGELHCAYKISAAAIFLVIHIEDVILPIDTAIPCGLLINELLTNSLKYAFPGGRKGEVTIEMQRSADGVRLLFVDNGVGFTTEVDFNKTETFGLRLVHMLVKQLDGSIEQFSDNGTRYEIMFKLAKTQEIGHA